MAEGPGFDWSVQSQQNSYIMPQNHLPYRHPLPPLAAAHLGPGIGFSPQEPPRVLPRQRQWYNQGFAQGTTEGGPSMPRPMETPQSALGWMDQQPGTSELTAPLWRPPTVAPVPAPTSPPHSMLYRLLQRQTPPPSYAPSSDVGTSLQAQPFMSTQPPTAPVLPDSGSPQSSAASTNYSPTSYYGEDAYPPSSWCEPLENDPDVNPHTQEVIATSPAKPTLDIGDPATLANLSRKEFRQFLATATPEECYDLRQARRKELHRRAGVRAAARKRLYYRQLQVEVVHLRTTVQLLSKDKEQLFQQWQACSEILENYRRLRGLGLRRSSSEEGAAPNHSSPPANTDQPTPANTYAPDPITTDP